MLTFFHGWRRKIGCVILVMALALMVLWMRSRVCFDFVDLNLSQATYRVCTLGECARFVKQTPPYPGQLLGWRTGELTDVAGYGKDKNGQPEKSLLRLQDGISNLRFQISEGRRILGTVLINWT